MRDELVIPEREVSSAAVGAAATSINTFAYPALQTATAAAPGENVMISPLSIVVALGMLEPGTSGPGQQALRELLGIDQLEFPAQSSAELVVPRFTARVNVALEDVLRSLGLEALFAPGSLAGMSDDTRLVVDDAFHQSMLAIDENGLEAAAATILTMYPVSAPLDPPVPVVLDRPFLFRIVDDTTGTVLFLGQITDPAA